MVNVSKDKVLIVHNYYQIAGGEDTVVANEKKLLEENGHEVVLYSRSNSELRSLSKLEKLCLPFTTIFSLRTYREIKKIITEHKIDIVHVHNTLTLVSPSVYYAALACKVPVVQSIHNFRFLCPAATFYREDNKGNGAICEMCVSKGLKCSIKYSCYRSSRLQTLACVVSLKIHRMLKVYKKINYILLTDFNKEKFLQLNKKKVIIDPEKLFIKPNFVDSQSKNLPFEQRKNQFIFAGRLDKLKGIHLLLEAWMDIKDSDLIICGAGPEKELCEEFIRDNGMSNVKMFGLVENNKLQKIIAESKALILPTQWYEGFPMTIVESLACGTPVIGSNIGNVSNLIKDGVSGRTFQYNSVESLRDAVKNITDMVESSTNQYKENYTSHRNYTLLNSIYHSIK